MTAAMRTRIPNYDTLSTILDRITIENVKKAHFQDEISGNSVSEAHKAALEKKIATQDTIIARLNEELIVYFKESLSDGHYTYITEERTFT